MIILILLETDFQLQDDIELLPEGLLDLLPNPALLALDQHGRDGVEHQVGHPAERATAKQVGQLEMRVAVGQGQPQARSQTGRTCNRVMAIFNHMPVI